MKNNDDKNGINRRGFIQKAALIGAVAGISSVFNINKAKGFCYKKISTPYKRTLGRGISSMDVSSIGFGCMGLNYHRGPYPDKSFCINLLHLAVDHGYTLFDTAESYGPFTNEELVGEGLSKIHKAGKIAITSKFGHDYDYLTGKPLETQNSRPEHIRYVVENSLKRLKVEYIDLMYQHRLDKNVPIEDVVLTLKELIKEGKIKNYGLCEVNGDTIKRAHKIHPVAAIQSEYHLMYRNVEKDVLPLCEELGIGFVPYSPINRGMLGGMLNEYTNFNNISDNRNILPRFQTESLRKNMKFVEAIIEFGRTRGMTPAQISLAWLLSKKPFVVPIPGTTKPAHMIENINTLNFNLTKNDINELEGILANIPICGERYPLSQQKLVEQ